MVPSAWLSLASATVGPLLAAGLFGGAVASSVSLRQPASPLYRSRNNVCPTSCVTAGPNPANWTVYNNLQDLQSCTQTIFYHVSIFDMVETPGPHRIYACTSYGTSKTPDASAAAADTAIAGTNTTTSNATFTIGHWDENTPEGVDLRAVSKQVRRFLAAGYTSLGSSSSSSSSSSSIAQVLFAQTTSSTVGLYVGKAVQNVAATVNGALSTMESQLAAANATSGTVALELCGAEHGYDADHVIGFIATSNTSFTPVQQVLQSWANATCIDFNSTMSFGSTVAFSAPLAVPAANSTLNSTLSSNNTLSARSLHLRGSSRHQTLHDGAVLAKRADCTTVQVVSGDSCASLATKCGISAADFTTYNPSSTLCSSLTPGQHVCCSAGTLPDFAPQPNADGSCYAYTVVANDNCAGLAATYDLTTAEIEAYNNQTWGWSGCSNVLLGAVICLSTGSPPMPAAVANAECGPQVPGTVAGPGGTYNLSGLNPCPLNACCDIWGECGITADFCTDTGTGAPGTAATGTNGCISNCGTDVVQGAAPAQYISLAYYEGYNMDRACLYQDISQLDTAALTHVHFAFATLSADYTNVSVGSTASAYQFDSFVRLGSAVHRVLTFGGWTFSTDPSTYSIFREGVTAANREAMATAMANYILEYDLDGVDIDWEYPGAPDIPGIPAASTDDGANYLAFLKVLKGLLPGKTVSIAAPASYWYLQGFPIAEIAAVVDYIVFMTYDLHGQWDAGNAYAQEGCPTGNCLRSHVNLTETMTSLAMITKAGVPSGQVVVGVSSYGRSFGMTDGSCYTPECTFGGTAGASTATPGVCTDTAGYIADAEINDIVAGTTSTVSRRAATVNEYYYDAASDSQVLVYNGNQWVAFMTPAIRTSRTALYQGLSLGGTTNWASDLETYNAAPGDMATWSEFLLAISAGVNPLSEKATSTVTGNWTTLTCADPAVSEVRSLSPQLRWDEMDCPDAWADVTAVWTNSDNGTDTSLTESISASINGPENADCGSLAATNNCQATILCKLFEDTGGSGPAGYEIWNSMVYVHELYQSFYDGIVAAAALSIDSSLPSFEDTFAPVTPPDDEWLDILLDIVNLAGTVVVSGFFNTILKGLPYFRENGVSYDNYKDTGKALVSFAVSITGTYITGKSSDWTATSQDSFSAYLGQCVDAWANATSLSLQALFNGNADSLLVLTNLISDGKMIEGAVNGAAAYPNMTVSTQDLEAIINLAFYAFAIPAAWSAAGINAFVLDAGADCSDLGVAADYVSSSDQDAAHACVDNRLYFLMYPDGKSSDTCPLEGSCTDNTFSMPPGSDQLTGSSWGGITVADIITGSVRTYVQNGGSNGGSVTNPDDAGSLEDLYDQDITTPGYIRLPVCSGELAYSNWQTNSDTSSLYWPCYVAPPKNDCQSSSFIDQTSDASPSVDDCQHIIDNIVGTTGEWTTQVVGENQRQLVSYGSCKFGVQATDEHGNVNFKVAAQDIVDIITDAISQFGGSGKVGAKGYMDCSGNINSQDIEWGLY
ncbi:hypothetical protein SCUCBS95973_001630 [Sporothrix curviconia]|uniref:chitinase n=1 Tax=Sporothrix curviconia TaxID=1260050 RepID=A0ABP0B091_9PEZI